MKNILNQYKLAKFTALADATQAKAIGVKPVKDGYEGLLRGNARELKNATIIDATIDNVMVHFEKANREEKMLNLIKKEMSLCLHPTAFIFLSFAALVFVPNYPYEVIFFFSCLSVFFCCMMTRENGDISFSCTLPVKKEQIPLAKMSVVFGLQCIIMLLVGIIGAIKGAILSAEQYLNYSGISANLVLVGNGAILLGIFNLIFFPRYFKNPDEIGVPFVIGAIVIFLLIGVFIVLRWVTPLYSTILNGLNSENTGAKLVALAIGIVIYAVLSAASCKLSMKNFQSVDL